MGAGRGQRAVVLVIGLLLLATACGSDDGDTERAETTTSAPTTTVAEGLPEVEDIEAVGGQAIEALPFADWVTVAGDSAWVANGQLIRVDPATGEELAEIDVAPTSIFLAVGEGGVWTLGADTAEVTHVDPVTDTVVATIPVGDGTVSGGDIAVGGGYVWARVSDSLVAQIDPATDQVVARFGPPAGSGSVAADDDAVWISAHDVDTVWRLPLG